MSFSIIHDLGPLSPEARAQYLRDASIYFGLDPDLNALDAIWMDAGDGGRRLVAYARRGTTDLLREIHGIQVLSLTQHDGPGYVSFTATVRTKSGRQEMAVGASTTTGSGDRLAAAVATAQTRALRRATLQAVGGGILDESELNQTTTDINRASQPLSSIATAPAPQPSVQPNATAGRDITEVVQYTPDPSITSRIPLSSIPKPFENGSIIPTWVQTPQLAVDLVGSAACLAPKGSKRGFDPAVPAPFADGSIIPTLIASQDQTPPGALVEPKKRRGRKPKEESIDVAINVESDGLPNGTPPPGTLVIQPTIYVDQVREVEPTRHEPVLEVQKDNMPTAAETLVWKAELNKYTSTTTGILIKAGMTAGPIGRVRAYAIKTFGVQPDSTGKLPLTNSQWHTLLETFKRVSTMQSDVELVKLIESASA